jgi:hypothetical protein
VAALTLAVLLTFSQFFSWDPFAILWASKEDMDAIMDANAAKKEILTKKMQGEKEPIQVSGCVQKPDGYEQGHHPKIPDTIFVSVASYRDDECKDTVFDLFAKAKDPDSIFVGVCQQNKENEEDCFDRCPDCAARKQSGHIRVTNFDYMDARGPTFARYQCSKLWRGEEFYFQIDSHLEFQPGWDVVLKEQMRATNDPKAVVGAYPPTTEQLNDMLANDFSTMITMCPGEFDQTGLPTITARVVNTNGRKNPLPVAYMPAGMVCFPGSALYDVPYDPYLSYLFFGEEVLFSARLFTAGYNLYAPAKNFCEHHYGREGKPKYHQDHQESEACKKKAIQRVKYMLGFISKNAVHPDYFLDADKYGMGKVRPLSEYFKFAGINPTLKTVSTSCPQP